MAEQSRDVQEQQLASLRRALGHANNNLKVMHSLRQARAGEQSTGDRLDAAQTAIVTLEERIGLLENDLARAYPSSDQSFATQLVVPESYGHGNDERVGMTPDAPTTHKRDN